MRICFAFLVPSLSSLVPQTTQATRYQLQTRGLTGIQGPSTIFQEQTATIGPSRATVQGHTGTLNIGMADQFVTRHARTTAEQLYTSELRVTRKHPSAPDVKVTGSQLGTREPSSTGSQTKESTANPKVFGTRQQSLTSQAAISLMTSKTSLAADSTVTTLADSTVTSQGYLTADSTVTSQGSLTADSTVTSQGYLTADSTVTSQGSLTADSTVTSQGSLTADSTVTSQGYLTADSTVTSQRSLTADSTVTSQGSLTASSTVTSQRSLTADSTVTSQGSATHDFILTSYGSLTAASPVTSQGSQLTDSTVTSHISLPTYPTEVTMATGLSTVTSYQTVTSEPSETSQAIMTSHSIQNAAVSHPPMTSLMPPNPTLTSQQTQSSIFGFGSGETKNSHSIPVTSFAAKTTSGQPVFVQRSTAPPPAPPPNVGGTEPQEKVQSASASFPIYLAIIPVIPVVIIIILIAILYKTKKCCFKKSAKNLPGEKSFIDDGVNSESSENLATNEKSNIDGSGIADSSKLIMLSSEAQATIMRKSFQKWAAKTPTIAANIPAVTPRLVVLPKFENLGTITAPKTGHVTMGKENAESGQLSIDIEESSEFAENPLKSLPELGTIEEKSDQEIDIDDLSKTEHQNFEDIGAVEKNITAGKATKSSKKGKSKKKKPKKSNKVAPTKTQKAQSMTSTQMLQSKVGSTYATKSGEKAMKTAFTNKNYSRWSSVVNQIKSQKPEQNNDPEI